MLLKNKTLNLSDQSSNSTFNVHNPHRMKLFTRLQVGLNQLREHKFRQNFQDFRQLFCNYVGISKQYSLLSSLLKLLKSKENPFRKN